MSPDESDDRKKKPRPDGMSLLKSLIQNVERLQQRQQKDSEIIDDLLWWLYQLDKAMRERHGAAPRRPKARPAEIPKGPAPTVRDVQIATAGNGGAIATFDDAKQVTLSGTVKEVLAILAAGDGESPDDLAAWKTFDRLAGLLEKRLGRKFNRHGISQLLLRLRNSLEEAGLSRDLIESAPGLGVRLRLKRTPPTELQAG